MPLDAEYGTLPELLSTHSTTGLSSAPLAEIVTSSSALPLEVTVALLASSVSSVVAAASVAIFLLASHESEAV